MESRAGVAPDLESLLYDDPHFWLQRGSYELERGDIVLAENFLNQARGLSEGDHMIDTEWAYLLMQKACRDQADMRAPEWFRDALDILYTVIDEHPSDSPNTYVVLAEHVTRWSQSGRLTFEEQLALLQSVRAVLAQGRRHYVGNAQFKAARQFRMASSSLFCASG